MQYSFNLYNKMAPTGILMALGKMIADEKPPVVLCIGSDLVTGDSLGPVTGTLICRKTEELSCFVYGNLSAPVTAKEVRYAESFLRKTHPGQKIIAVDAAVGAEGEVGLIRVQDVGLNPGSGAGKKMSKVGDVSILGIIAEKSIFNYALLNSIRLNVVYQMSEIIAEGISQLLRNA
jgi:putative sporulation protein YyaC